MIVIGMAGSGKSKSSLPSSGSQSWSPSLTWPRTNAATFMQRVNSYLHSQNQPPYVLNLDPAVIHLPFEANIDIRDTVDYAEVMKQYNLGPNGGIMTALNLFTTKFDQVLGHVEKRANEVECVPVPFLLSVAHCTLILFRPTRSYVLLDTPGQIEIFTWSASGSIITDALASALPTVVVYIIDTPRTTAPATFMSNMLYACSYVLASPFAKLRTPGPRPSDSPKVMTKPRALCPRATASCTRPDSRSSSCSTRPTSNLTSLRSTGCATLKRSRTRSSSGGRPTARRTDRRIWTA